MHMFAGSVARRRPVGRDVVDVVHVVGRKNLVHVAKESIHDERGGFQVTLQLLFSPSFLFLSYLHIVVKPANRLDSFKHQKLGLFHLHEI
jgi:hypothetical protein